MSEPFQPGFLVDLDEPTRRAVLDLIRQVRELQATVEDHETRIEALEP